VIIRNAVQCDNCDQLIQSTNVLGFVECICKECFVDGGNSYFRYGGNCTTLFVETHKPFIPFSVQLENSEFTLAAHHPDTCVGKVCALHKRTDHNMRDLHQSVDMVGNTFVMTRICEHGVAHTDPDDYFVYDIDYCKVCDLGRKEVIYA